MFSPPLKPVDGVVIRRPVFSTFAFLFALAVALVYMSALLWEMIDDKTGFDPGVDVARLVVHVAAMLLIPLAAVLAWAGLRQNRRMVLGVDRLQVLERERGRDVIALQIPYANLADVQYGPTKTGRLGLCIALDDLYDSQTFAAGERFDANWSELGYHLVLPGGYQRSLNDIAQELQLARGRWERSRTATS